MNKKKLVIVGCGMGSGKLVEELLGEEDSKKLDITIIGDDPHGNYDRIKLCGLLTDLAEEDISLNSKEWFESNHVNAHLGKKATSIDRENKLVTLEDNTKIEYDRLVLAMGSQPLVPPTIRTDLQGVFTLHSLDDATRMKSWIADKSQ